MKIENSLIPEISLSRDRTISLKRIRFINSDYKLAFIYSEEMFQKKEHLILETKIMYFPLLMGKLLSRSRNMLLDEYFELDFQMNSLAFIANSLCKPNSQIQSNF